MRFYRRGDLDNLWKINVQYQKEIGLSGIGSRTIGKLCGKGVLGKYYNVLGHIKLDISFGMVRILSYLGGR